MIFEIIFFYFLGKFFHDKKFGYKYFINIVYVHFVLTINSRLKALELIIIALSPVSMLMNKIIKSASLSFLLIYTFFDIMTQIFSACLSALIYIY